MESGVTTYECCLKLKIKKYFSELVPRGNRDGVKIDVVRRIKLLFQHDLVYFFRIRFVLFFVFFESIKNTTTTVQKGFCSTPLMKFL